MPDTSGTRLAFPPGLAEKLRASPATFIITGGGGWIGQATLEMLESALGDGIKDKIAVYGSGNRALTLRSGRTLPCRELSHIADIDSGAKLFIHYAYLTRDKLSGQSAADFIAGNQRISDYVAGAVVKGDARGFFGLSSGAVYKAGTRNLDTDLEANPYGVMKLADEKRFAGIAAGKPMPFVMPRLFNLSGPFINKWNAYALASMIRDALQKKPIAIRAAHRVVRSYVHVADLVTLGFSMMLDAQPGDAPIFDTAGDDRLDIGELAKQIRTTLGQPQLAIERPALVEGRDDVYVGDGRAMQALLQSRALGLRNLQTQIRDTADYMAALDEGIGTIL